MRVENKPTLVVTKQEYSTILELIEAMGQYCESFNCCESCPFKMGCNEESDVPGMLRKFLSEIQVSS